MMDNKEPVMTSGSRSPLAPPAAREVAAQFARRGEPERGSHAQR
jgi:hypothetical protein